jgi:hypothetical protein
MLFAFSMLNGGLTNYSYPELRLIMPVQAEIVEEAVVTTVVVTTVITGISI